MSRNLDATLAAALGDSVIAPIVLVAITFKSGIAYAWSGIGDLVWNGNTYKGMGQLGAVGAIIEESGIEAKGTTVTLSGLAASGVDPTLGITAPSNPVSVPSGQSVAWAYPSTVAATGGIGNGSRSLIRGCTGASSGSAASQGHAPAGSAGLSVSGSTPPGELLVDWSDFVIDGGLPDDAVIHNIYPVIIASATKDASAEFYSYGTTQGSTGLGHNFSSPSNPNSTSFTSTQWNGASIGTSLTGWGIEINLQSSLNIDFPADAIAVSNVAYAVYYSSASGILPSPSLIDEALGDIQIGAPAKIWIGQLDPSTMDIIGTPYLYFVGTVDKATMKVGAEEISISLALENRLVNLQRASMTRYTSADQNRTYPDDSAFDWVEQLNDQALRCGS